MGEVINRLAVIFNADFQDALLTLGAHRLGAAETCEDRGSGAEEEETTTLY